jgi:hypothetical protein
MTKQCSHVHAGHNLKVLSYTSVRTNLLKQQPQQVHGRRPSSSKSASDAAPVSQEDAGGVGSVLSAGSPPLSSGRGSKSPPALTPTSPRSNSTDKRTSAPALSPVTLQDQVGLQTLFSSIDPSTVADCH